MRLPEMAEPLVVDPFMDADDEVECYATRQMRRRARRAEAKAARRRGLPAAPAIVAEAVEEVVDFVASREEARIEAPIEPIADTPVDTSVDSLVEALAKARAETASIPGPVAIEEAEATPLPNNRALAKRPSGFLARLFGGWTLRRSPNLERRDPDPLTEQMLVLRTELALVQMRLDRIIKAASA